MKPLHENCPSFPQPAATGSYSNIWLNDCMFCMKHNFYSHLALLNINSIQEILIHETTNFIVLPDIAPIVEGYLLIIPKDHYLSLGHLDLNLISELRTIMELVRTCLEENYDSPVFFEHGPSAPKKAGCCVEHAHLHCVPFSKSFNLTLDDKLKPHKICDIGELQKFAQNKISYLYLQSRPNQHSVIPLDNKTDVLPSQYLRQVLAHKLGTPLWNWRQMVSEIEIMEQSKYKIFNALNRLKTAACKYNFQS